MGGTTVGRFAFEPGWRWSNASSPSPAPTAARRAMSASSTPAGSHCARGRNRARDRPRRGVRHRARPRRVGRRRRALRRVRVRVTLGGGVRQELNDPRTAPVRPGCGRSPRPLGGALDRDDEAHAVAAAAGERSARVLPADRVHVAAALVGTLLHHAALEHGHPVGIATVDDRERDARIAAHVLGLPRHVGGTDEHVVALESDPDDVVAWRAVRPQRGEMDVASTPTPRDERSPIRRPPPRRGVIRPTLRRAARLGTSTLSRPRRSSMRPRPPARGRGAGIGPGPVHDGA